MSTINLDSARYVIWGYRLDDPAKYHTHAHIHHGLYRAAHFLRPGALWLDEDSNISGMDFENTIFITEHDAAKRGMPLREDCFYVVHGMSDDAMIRGRISSVSKYHLSWNVYHDYSHVYGTQGNPACHGITTMQFPLTEKVWLGEDCPFYPREQHLDFRWATDLLPHEIMGYKRWSKWNPESRVINYVGTFWHVNQKEIAAFRTACEENSVEFRHYGAGQEGVMSIEDNIRLVRESRFAPAIVGSHHITEGYAPCRIFKNISYGMMGITNSERVNDIFGGKLIYHPDPYKLYYHSIEELQSLSAFRVHDLMDEVAAKHTYVQRISKILEAAHHVAEN